MRRQVATVLYVLVLIATVVSADLLFFRHRFLERLIANIVIVLLFGAAYRVFGKRPAASRQA